jgi:hypothetical protein
MLTYWILRKSVNAAGLRFRYDQRFVLHEHVLEEADAKRRL